MRKSIVVLLSVAVVGLIGSAACYLHRASEKAEHSEVSPAAEPQSPVAAAPEGAAAEPVATPAAQTQATAGTDKLELEGNESDAPAPAK
jgi:flagellar basal body-associated protein FliL